jgi:hypothetical protein
MKRVFGSKIEIDIFLYWSDKCFWIFYKALSKNLTIRIKSAIIATYGYCSNLAS